MMLYCLKLILPISCLLLAGCVGTGPKFDLGPLILRDTDMDGNRRLRMVGPLFESQKSKDDKTFIAVRPFFSSIDDPGKERLLREFLWPAGMIKKFRGETYWRFLTAFGHDFDNTQPDSRFRFIVFPFLFAGRDRNNEKYFAIFPLGGKINEFLGRDRIVFALFPLYAFSSVNDVKTYDVLWPFLSWSEGGEVKRVRVFPFYGKSVNSGRWVKKFVLWPIWTSVRYDYPGSEGGGFVLFPLYGHARTNDRESWTVLPPFFRWSRSDEHKELNCPWPIIQYSAGKVDKFYIWPLWGKKSMKGSKSWFVLWKFITGEEIDRGEYVLNRFSILPVISYESRVGKDANSKNDRPEAGDQTGREEGGGDSAKPATDDVIARYFKLWPLMSYRREGNAARFRALDLWPLKNTSGIEKNLAPFWTLYSHERIGDAREDELLWGLFRYRRDGRGGKSISLFPVFSSRKSGEDGGSREWSFLCGFAGYKREGLRKSYRLLYFLKWSRGEKHP